MNIDWKLNPVKIIILPKLIHRFNVIAIKIPRDWLMELEKLFLILF